MLTLTASTCLLAALLVAPPPVSAPTIARGPDGLVTLTAAPGLEIRYWVQAPGAGVAALDSQRYEKPFALPGGGIVHAVAIPDDGRRLTDAAFARAEFPGPDGAIPKPPATPPAKPKLPGWEDLKIDPAAPPITRTTDAFPLSDQQNQDRWKPYAAMTDEFSGATLDQARWWPTNPSWKGRPPGLFLPRNVRVRDGELQLTMRKETVPEMEKLKGYHTYTCAAVQSKTAVRYGYFEVRAQAMKSAGSSAFWFYHGTKPWWTEIDVFEIGGKSPSHERKLHITLHVFRTPAIDHHWQVGSASVAPADLADAFHVYGLEWDQKELKFYFDGRLVRRGPNTHWHQPLTLNFDSETMPDWFKLPKDEDLPSTYRIDYVRAWRK